MSETVTVETQFKDPAAFEAAVCALGGTVLGRGSHRLYQGNKAGLGVKLPGWLYPLVLDDAGRLAYDDFKGAWGDVRMLDQLSAEYILGAAEQAAMSRGLMCERQALASGGSRLVIYHEGGRSVTVDVDQDVLGVQGGGSHARIEAHGFQGVGCAEATQAIAEALGVEVGSSVKPEYNLCQQTIKRGE